MFTGIIEEIGNATAVENIAGGFRIKIRAEKNFNELKVGDSVSVNGVCLTVIRNVEKYFWIDAVGETLIKSTLKNIKTNSFVNLERALRLSDRLGGHFVQGHVNGIGIISTINKLGENYKLVIEIPKELSHYMIDEGSVAIDGISLTIAKVENTVLNFSIIPYTWSNTILMFKKLGDEVNIEVDIIAKYLEKYLGQMKKNKITDGWLKNLGY
ncbi:MAG: riboflavin synthase [Bacteroidetes bacterium]|nr:riboflavin synthase [Bacteroidota bacterium]MBU2585698.1 riboflavin synthase [Bacteroidota bacterium]